MKSKLLLSIVLIFIFRIGYSTQFTVVTSGFTFVPANTFANVGDTINFPGSTTHPLVQVDENTWNNFGNTQLSGGWGIKTTNFQYIIHTGGDIFFVCDNHHLSHMMRGKITIPVSITEFTVLPVNITSLDTVKIAVSSMFTSSPCIPDSFTVNQAGNVISITGYFCTGILTTICNRTDTVKINPLPAGNYSFQFSQMVSGNCDGIYNEENTASGAATVTFASGFPDVIKDNAVSIYPNPVKNGEMHIDILNGNYKNNRLLLYSLQGQLISDEQLSSSKNMLKLNFPPGIYFFRIMNDGQEVQEGKIQIE